MARPRVFISSTFYDLRQIRADIDQFLRNMGYESIRNEVGAIPYGKDERLEDYCAREVQHSDIIVSIIGGRFGAESREMPQADSKTDRGSISQRELKTALENNKQVYIFIDKNVAAEYQTYLLNKEADINFKYVDDKRIYKFIEEIKGLGVNNNIKEFETSEDIVSYLKEQFAGLFQRFLDSQTRMKEYAIIKELESTSQNLNKLVEYLSNQNKDKDQAINQILMLNHPLITKLKQNLSIPYNFYIEGLTDLDSLLYARSFEPIKSPKDGYLEWKKDFSDGSYAILSIKSGIFDAEGTLKYIKPQLWDDTYFGYTKYSPANPTSKTEDVD